MQTSSLEKIAKSLGAISLSFLSVGVLSFMCAKPFEDTSNEIYFLTITGASLLIGSCSAIGYYNLGYRIARRNNRGYFD